MLNGVDLIWRGMSLGVSLSFADGDRKEVFEDSTWSVLGAEELFIWGYFPKFKEAIVSGAAAA